MAKIWQKTPGTNSLNQAIESYTVGSDYLLDMELLPYDVRGSKAHAFMLHSIGVLTRAELGALIGGLDEILDLYSSGEFIIDKSQEDSHAAIEEYLTAKIGAAGGKIHTGRSRNDQILVTMRLFTQEKIRAIEALVQTLVVTLDDKIAEVGDTLMPGYTHTQRAMPSSVGMWLGSFREALADDLGLIAAAKAINDQNPLGSVAGFGENVFGLDRAMVTSTLGFAKTQTNPMYCSYSRGKFEHIVLQALSQVMLDLGKFASDLVWFSSREFDFFTLPDEFKTGSSVMPQKKNWDVMELMRGNANLFLGYEFQIREVFKMLLSGYNRDFQLTKEPYLRGIALAISTVEVATLVAKNLGVKKEKLKAACTEELYATEEAYRLVKNGMSFRDAYRQIGQKYL